MITEEGTIMITRGGYSDDYEGEGKVMITGEGTHTTL